MKHKVREIEQQDIESLIPKVINAVEERDMVQVEAGVGIYAALEMASKDGVNTIFSGQGPDELWGGYSWYPKLAGVEGYPELDNHMWNDLSRSDIETLDRENKIALALGSEQVFPYCDVDIIELATRISPKMKVNSSSDAMGKHPHREAAVRLGVPEEIAYRGKNAAQHSTGVHGVLDAVARKNGFDPDMVETAGYDSDIPGVEKLASSTRYGYRFDNPELWKVADHIQFYLDYLAYNQGMLNERERLVIRKHIDRANLI
jgi:asparagine synthase (glutamine-hydrolysing)